jgi:hypothetical protein
MLIFVAIFKFYSIVLDGILGLLAPIPTVLLRVSRSLLSACTTAMHKVPFARCVVHMVATRVPKTVLRLIEDYSTIVCWRILAVPYVSITTICLMLLKRFALPMRKRRRFGWAGYINAK